jgi:hypothetical protein
MGQCKEVPTLRDSEHAEPAGVESSKKEGIDLSSLGVWPRGHETRGSSEKHDFHSHKDTWRKRQLERPHHERIKMDTYRDTDTRGRVLGGVKEGAVSRVDCSEECHICEIEMHKDCI